MPVRGAVQSIGLEGIRPCPLGEENEREVRPERSARCRGFGFRRRRPGGDGARAHGSHPRREERRGARPSRRARGPDGRGQERRRARPSCRACGSSRPPSRAPAPSRAPRQRAASGLHAPVGPGPRAARQLARPAALEAARAGQDAASAGGIAGRLARFRRMPGLRLARRDGGAHPRAAPEPGQDRSRRRADGGPRAPAGGTSLPSRPHRGWAPIGPEGSASRHCQPYSHLDQIQSRGHAPRGLWFARRAGEPAFLRSPASRFSAWLRPGPNRPRGSRRPAR